MRPPLFADRQTPLFVKFDTRPIWPEIKATFGVDATGAAIIMALHEAQNINNGWVSYSRSRTFYATKARHPLLTFRSVVAAVDALDAGGWIEHHRQVPGGRGWQSSMQATPQLMDAMGRILEGGPPLRLVMPSQTIILRDADGREIDPKPTRDIDRRGRQVEALNEAVTSAEVLTMDGRPVTAPMRRIHNDSMDRGGRLYGLGPSWQNIPKEDRKRVTIDGEAVVELDFVSLHPALLYGEAGISMPEDCYAIGRWPRPLVKVAVLTLINAATVQAARLSIAHSVHMAELAEDEQQALRLASQLVEDIKTAHRPIAHAFHSDAGARLMRKDSDLAVSIMLELRRKGIIALPVHDSFLVPASQRDALEAAMMRAAHAIGLREIRIKQA